MRQIDTLVISVLCFKIYHERLQGAFWQIYFYLGAVDLCSTYINQPTLVATS